MNSACARCRWNSSFQEIAAELSDNRHLHVAAFSVIEQNAGTDDAMSSLDFDIDAQMMQLETEWRQAYEASVGARADYQKLASDRNASAVMLDLARERLDRAEAVTAQIMIKIERLEASILD